MYVRSPSLSPLAVIDLFDVTRWFARIRSSLHHCFPLHFCSLFMYAWDRVTALLDSVVDFLHCLCLQCGSEGSYS
jgi:hypothetical protein